MTDAVRGSGQGKSGGGGARIPIEAADTLRSTSFAVVQDLICEGEIEGLVNGEQSVYLDGTPIQNEDGSFNFTGVEAFQFTNGTQNQLPMKGFEASSQEFGVNVEVVAATPVTRTITNANTSSVRVRLAIPGLSKQNLTNGDITGTSVRIAIDIQANGGGYVAQNIGFAWESSVNPGVKASIGLKIEADWQYTPPVKTNRGYTQGGTVNFTVQYKLIGAGSWTSVKTDNFQSVAKYTGYSRGVQQITSLLRAARTYTVLDLPSGIYEARIVLDAGAGVVGVKSLQILTAVPYDDITGKASSTYQRSYTLALTGSAPWDVRLRRITADSGSASLRNKTFFDAYAQVVDSKFSYPNSALIGARIDAAQFSTIPNRGYDVKLLRVKIPSNYNPVTRVYTGVWDGLFIVAWTDNPAWCFYDLVTNTRYGLGKFIPEAQVDKWGLYTIGQYCDGLVPDQLGHEEPRFTCNIYIQTREEAYTVVMKMASIFRGMAYWAAGTLTAVQDAPADPVFLFTEANVIDGLFSYSGTSKHARHTVALVSWNDPEDGYKLKPEYVEDPVGIARFGVIQTDITAVGCISRGQAHRVGEWLLYSEQQETEIVTFKCGHDGTYLRPGSIFSVQDQHRAGIRFGGRVLSATSTTVTLDSSITIQSGVTYTIQVVLNTGALDVRTVTTGPSTTNLLTVSVAFTVTPIANAVWILTSTALSPRLYRAVSVAEVERNQYEVLGVAHNPTKFDYIERDYLLSSPVFSTLSTVPKPPQNIVITESLHIVAGQLAVLVIVTWEPVQGASHYRLEWRRESGNFVRLTDVRQASAQIDNQSPGFYEVRLQAINMLGVGSIETTASRQIYGKAAPPADVTGFLVVRNGEQLVFSWNAIADLDVSHYQIRQGNAWDSGITVIDRVVATRFQLTTHIGGNYLIKAFDTSGNQSINAAVIIIGEDDDINVVVVSEDNPSWLGVKVGTQGDSAGLTLENSQRWNTLTNTWNTYTATWYGMGTWTSPGTYETVPVDLGVVLTSRVEVNAVTEQIQLTTVTWLSLTQPWLSYTQPWNRISGTPSIAYLVATSQDGVAYTTFGPFQSGIYTARAFKFKITLTTNNTGYIPRLKTFTVTVDVPDRVDHFEDRVIEPGGTTITFSPAFILVQTATGSMQGGAVGDTFRVTNKTTSSVTITAYDAQGNEKYANMDLDVFGYGKQ